MSGPVGSQGERPRGEEGGLASAPTPWVAPISTPRFTRSESCVCPAHGRRLIDQCPNCHGRLLVAFRLRENRARPVCARCESALEGRGGECQGFLRDLATALLPMQARIAVAVDHAPIDRSPLEEIVGTLWSPLDDPGASRPVLALWLSERGWRAPGSRPCATPARATATSSCGWLRSRQRADLSHSLTALGFSPGITDLPCALDSRNGTEFGWLFAHWCASRATAISYGSVLHAKLTLGIWGA